MVETPPYQPHAFPLERYTHLSQKYFSPTPKSPNTELQLANTKPIRGQQSSCQPPVSLEVSLDQ